MNNELIIGQRIDEILKLRNLKQKDLAEHLKVKDNTISYFCSGKRTPNTTQIIEIAKYLNVTTDYLLGLSPNSTTDMELIDVCNYTGLSESNVKFLNKLNELKKVNKKYMLNVEGDKNQYTEIEYIDIISELLSGLNEDRSIVVDISEAAMLNESTDFELLSKISNMISDNFPNVNNSDFKILSGYDYKKFYSQEIQLKVNSLISQTIHKLSPKESMSVIYNISKAITLTPKSRLSLEKMADIHIKCLLEQINDENKEDSDNAQHNPKNE
ncbi:MAG: helix-turn-helix transcriptional regulator [Oscillospiraceae bacterium]|nr:helix-turn-helix transcriptional regulator [Oscillospiraceae bacterium]